MNNHIRVPIKHAVGTKHLVKDGEVEILALSEGNRRATIRFTKTGYETTVRVEALSSKCKIKDKLKPSVGGVGILGIGPYVTTIDGKKTTPAYGKWTQMIKQGRITKHHVWCNYQLFCEGIKELSDYEAWTRKECHLIIPDQCIY